MTITTVLLAFAVAAATIVAFAVFLYELSLFTLPPFVPAPKRVLGAVVAALDLKDGHRLYDLGCGDGRVLEAALDAQPGIAAVGVDRNLFPLALADLRLRGRGAELRWQNFFKTPLADADRLYLYCWPSVLDRLLPKFERELRPGARVVCADFGFSKRRAAHTIDLPGPQLLVKKLLVYEF